MFRVTIIIAGLVILALPIVVLANVPVAKAPEGQVMGQANSNTGLGYIAAALAVGLGSLAAGLAVGPTASAAIGAVAEKEELAGKALVFVGLAEGVAIYGMVIAIMILNRI